MIKGLGKQMLCACFGLFSYYVLCLPLSYVFAFEAGMKLNGLWLGMPVGMLVLNFGYAGVIWCSDWQKIAIKASLRNSLMKKDVELE